MLSDLIFLTILAIKSRDEVLRLRRKMDFVEDLLVFQNEKLEQMLSNSAPRE